MPLSRLFFFLLLFFSFLVQGNQHSRVNGGQIRAQLPYIRTDVPVVLVFRALGYTNDKSILEHIVYDFSDTDMMEKFRLVSGRSCVFWTTIDPPVLIPFEVEVDMGSSANSGGQVPVSGDRRGSAAVAPVVLPRENLGKGGGGEAGRL